VQEISARDGAIHSEVAVGRLHGLFLPDGSLWPVLK
jgi:hypothetical protein